MYRNLAYTLSRSIMVRGRPVDAVIRVYCDPSEDSLEDVISDTEDRADLEQKIERGDLMIADICVEASALGCEGNDNLGACYISEPGDVERTLADNCMIDDALDELSKAIVEQADRLAPFASQGGAV